MRARDIELVEPAHVDSGVVKDDDHPDYSSVQVRKVEGDDELLVVGKSPKSDTREGVKIHDCDRMRCDEVDGVFHVLYRCQVEKGIAAVPVPTPKCLRCGTETENWVDGDDYQNINGSVAVCTECEEELDVLPTSDLEEARLQDAVDQQGGQA